MTTKTGNTNDEKQNILCILSPAKTMDSSDNVPDFIPDDLLTLPDCDLDKTREIAEAVKKLSKANLKSALKLSDRLTESTYQSWKDFSLDTITASNNKQSQKPCIYCYSGAAFQGLNIADCTLETVVYLQNHLRIMDAVYGCLRPLDCIQPYRLEMNTKLHSFPKLSEYWRETVTASLPPHTILLNLASNEYSAAVHLSKNLNTKTIQVLFRVKGRVVAVHAKRARGLMVRHLANVQANTLEHVKQFDSEGYRFIESESDETTLVFEKASSSTTQPLLAKKRTAVSSKTKSGSGSRKQKR